MKHTVPAGIKDYLPTSAALKILNVRKQTLYAYVSRGWIRSVPQQGRRDHLYVREDVEKVRSRSLARSGHGAVAASAMHWGEPIIPTSITEITPEGPRYRGRSAVQLARSGAAFETVAELLWSGIWRDEPFCWPVMHFPSPARSLGSSVFPVQSNDQLIELFALITLRLGTCRGSIADRVLGGRTLEAARQIILTLAGCLGYLSPLRRFVAFRSGEPVASGLLRALSVPQTEENREALQTILVLFADHELSPAAFAARVTASSGATLHSCIASAFCASSGVRIGQLYDRVEQFLAGATSSSVLLSRARRWQASGSAVPGFGHPLYPRGDPRGLLLLETVKRHSRQSKQLEAIYSFIERAEMALGLKPRHELALVTLALALGFPAHCSGVLFSLARTAGWVAHVQEQRLSGMLLRPRAKFVGT